MHLRRLHGNALASPLVLPEPPLHPSSLPMKLALIAGLSVSSTLTLSVAPEMTFGVESGAKHQKTYTHSLELEVDSGLMRMGDTEQEMPDEFSLILTHDMERVFLDHYVACEDGHPSKVERTLTSLSDVTEGEIIEGEGDEQTLTIEMESELTGEALTWSGDGEDYEVRPSEEDSDLDEDQLSGLTFDLDGLGLLPEADLDLEAGWEVEAAAILGLIYPGGDFQGQPNAAFEDDEDGVFRTIAMLPALGELDGDVSLRQIEGSGITLEIAGEISASIDAWQFVKRWDEAADDPFFNEVSSMEMTTNLELEGQLTWDPELGCLTGFELNAEVERVMTVSGEQGEMSMEMEMVFLGEAVWTLACEPVRD